MKKFIILMIILFAGVNGYAKLWNWVVANIGTYAITDYDVKKMNSFLMASGEIKTNDLDQAFKNILVIYSLQSIIDNDAKVKMTDKEIDDYIKALTNITNNEDPAAEYRLKLYQEFPDQYKLAIKKDQLVRTISYYNEELKTNSGLKVSENEIKNFYESNKPRFMDLPYLDFIVFAFERPKNLGLDELEGFETALSNMSELLKRSDDAVQIMAKYKNQVKFESYSGRSGLKPFNELITNNYPEEVLSISAMEKLTLPPKTVIIMTNGTVFGPQLVPIRKANKTVYIVLKIIEKKAAQPVSYDKVKEMIERKLRGDKLDGAIESFVKGKIIKREVTISVLDKSYEGVYNEFLRR